MFTNENSVFNKKNVSMQKNMKNTKIIQNQFIANFTLVFW